MYIKHALTTTTYTTCDIIKRLTHTGSAVSWLCVDDDRYGWRQRDSHTSQVCHCCVLLLIAFSVHYFLLLMISLLAVKVNIQITNQESPRQITCLLCVNQKSLHVALTYRSNVINYPNYSTKSDQNDNKCKKQLQKLLWEVGMAVRKSVGTRIGWVGNQCKRASLQCHRFLLDYHFILAFKI